MQRPKTPDVYIQNKDWKNNLFNIMLLMSIDQVWFYLEQKLLQGSVEAFRDLILILEKCQTNW